MSAPNIPGGREASTGLAKWMQLRRRGAEVLHCATSRCGEWLDMVLRLSELPEAEREHLAAIKCPSFARRPWIKGEPLAHRRIAIISTAGLQLRGDRSFSHGDGDYRVIPGDAKAAEIVMSHVSVNFDRTGFQQDINVVFPIDRLKELAATGE